MPPLGQHHAGAIDGDDLALEGHGGIHVGDALQRGEDIALVYPGGAHPYGRSVQIEGAELEQKLGAVAPGDDFDLALDAVGIHDLPGLQKLIFHLKYLPQAARPGGRVLRQRLWGQRAMRITTSPETESNWNVPPPWPQ